MANKTLNNNAVIKKFLVIGFFPTIHNIDKIKKNKIIVSMNIVEAFQKLNFMYSINSYLYNLQINIYKFNR